MPLETVFTEAPRFPWDAPTLSLRPGEPWERPPLAEGRAFDEEVDRTPFVVEG